MEGKIMVQSFRWFPAVTDQQVYALVKELRAKDSKELILFPDPWDKENHFLGVVLKKYYTQTLSNLTGVRDTQIDDDLVYLKVSNLTVRGFFSSLSRRIQSNLRSETEDEIDYSCLDDLFSPTKDTKVDPPKASAPPAPPKNPQDGPILEFLKTKTPAQIERELNEHIIGQPQLTAAVASFLYYHALRQLHPDLPQRPLLISGPSGSGKTEVWRVVSKLYSQVCPVKVIDGSNLSCDGWAGNFKLDTFINPALTMGGILVVDEFDKLVTPKHSSGGENVSLQMQSEFLKLFEGEYQLTQNKKPTGHTSKKMGFVLVGAFESLREQKQATQEKPATRIGFQMPQTNEVRTTAFSCALTDEDYIRFGIMPEVVGRIATKCTTNPLDDQAYMAIIRNSHSRVAMIEGVLQQYGIQVTDVISTQELQEMIAASRSNRTGVRWVSAQVENRLLESIREQGLFPALAG